VKRRGEGRGLLEGLRNGLWVTCVYPPLWYIHPFNFFNINLSSLEPNKNNLKEKKKNFNS
jgi:hypothetical protein